MAALKITRHGNSAFGLYYNEIITGRSVNRDDMTATSINYFSRFTLEETLLRMSVTSTIRFPVIFI